MSKSRFLILKYLVSLSLCRPVTSVHHYQAVVWGLCKYHRPLQLAGRRAAVDTVSRTPQHGPIAASDSLMVVRRVLTGASPGIIACSADRVVEPTK